MIEEAIARLKACTTERDLRRTSAAIETHATPLEVARLGGAGVIVPPAAQWIRSFVTKVGLGESPPEGYVRREFGRWLIAYTDPAVQTSRKTLIIGFVGTQGRLMLPAAMVLQRLPSERFDLALICDPSSAHFLNGAEGYASSPLELARSLARDLGAGRYNRLICCGVSVGGFAALRTGIILGADRSISVGGRFPWHPSRLIAGGKDQVSAFDVICCCNRDFSGELLCAYSDNETDRAHADRLAAVLRVSHLRAPETREHNLFLAAFQRGELEALFDRLFDVGPHHREYARDRRKGTPQSASPT
jgi:hypothetical protein